MQTKLLTNNTTDLQTAAELIRSGQTVVFPTETVYGIGADAKNPGAVKKIFEAKGRPADNPLIVHVSEKSQIAEIAAEITEDAQKLIDAFMPGPITVILKKRADVPNEVTAGLDTVGIRMPSNKTASEFLRLCGCPVAAPSANLSGKPSPTAFEHCVEDMSGRTAAIIDGGPCDVGIESTVIDMSGEPVIYRPGMISRAQIEEVLGKKVRAAESVKDGEKPRSPGLKYKHYSPKGRVVIIRGSLDEAADCVNSQTKPTGVILFDEILKEIKPKLKDGVRCVSLGGINKPDEAAAALFAALRKMDELGAEIIFAPEIPDTDKWAGVRNRLYRAAGGKVYNAAEFAGDGNKKEIKTVLFVCTGNTCRSPMAEGIFNHAAKERGLNITAGSAGLFVAPGSEVSENSVKAAAEIGVDISGHRPTRITSELIERSDLILTMSSGHKMMIASMPEAKGKTFTLCDYAGGRGEISDPFGGSLEVYEKCMREIKVKIDKIIKRLETQ